MRGGSDGESRGTFGDLNLLNLGLVFFWCEVGVRWRGADGSGVGRRNGTLGRMEIYGISGSCDLAGGNLEQFSG